MQHLTVELLLKAYAHGHFPMDNDGRIEWYHPNPRGIIPLDDRFHVPGRLARTIRSGRFRVTTDTAFEQVVRACAVPRPEQPTTWISERIVAAYGALHARGYAHSVETWDGADLVGGLYGVAVGGLFAGESMFSRGRDSSKVALVALVEHLRRNRFVVLDTQWVTPHLSQFGSYWMPDSLYQVVLASALRRQTTWEGFTG